MVIFVFVIIFQSGAIAVISVLVFFSYAIVLNTVVPISLYVRYLFFLSSVLFFKGCSQ